VAIRSVESFKDKIEIKLDERQVFYLFFGAAAIVTLVFVLGIMVGRRVESRAIVKGDVASDPLAALDRLEYGMHDELDFPEALRGKEGVTFGEVDATLLKRTQLEKKVHKAQAKLEEEKQGKLDALALQSAKEKIKGKDALAKVEALEASLEKEAPAKNEKSHKRFTLQIGSFQDKGEADAFFRTLAGSAYKPYMVEADVPGKGTYFRVRVGSYQDFEEALKAKAAFEESQHVIAYVTRLR